MAIALSAPLLTACGEGGQEPLEGQDPLLPTTAASHGRGVAGRGISILDPQDPGRPYFHRVGPISYDVRRALTFQFHNGDPEPVDILGIQPACACIRPVELTTEDGVRGRLSGPGPLITIPSGGVARLELRLDTAIVAPEQQNRDKLVVVRIRTSSAESPFLMLEVSFKPERLFTMGRAELNLGAIPANGSAGSEVQILTGLPASPARILEVLESPPGMTIGLEELSTGGEPFWLLTAEVDPPTPRGALAGDIVLSTTNGEGWGEEGRLTIPVRGQVVDDVILEPATLSFGSAARGTTLEATLRSLLPGQRLLLSETELTGPSAPHLSLRAIPRSGDEQSGAPWWTLEVTVLESHPQGPVQAELWTRTNDPSYPEFRRPLVGSIR